MFSLFGFLFALRFGTIPLSATPASIPVRAEAREVAAQTALPLDVATQVIAGTSAQHISGWAMGQPSGPAVGPAFHTYCPDEWVLKFAQQLHVADLGITRAAMWVAKAPVELDLRPGRFFMRVTVRTH